MTRQESTPKPENADVRAKDQQRLKQCDDERLSKKAGYGRNTNKPQSAQ